MSDRSADKSEQHKDRLAFQWSRKTKVLVVVSCVMVLGGGARIAISFASGLQSGDVFLEVSAFLVGTLIIIGMALAGFSWLKASGDRRVQALLSARPSVLVIKRALYVEGTDGIVQELGGAASRAFGPEQLTIGVDKTGLYFVGNEGDLVLFVPQEEILQVEVGLYPMTIGIPQRGLGFLIERGGKRFYLAVAVRTDDRIAVRNMSGEDVSKVRLDVMGRLGIDIVRYEDNFGNDI